VPEGKRLLASCAEGVASVLGDMTLQLRGAPSLSNLLEHFAAASCLQHFFETGQLLPRAALHQLLDGEYLCGVMAFLQTLSKYAIGRATEADVGSVLVCQELVGSAFQKLQEFDFRNGPLRRKFDGIKYVVRKCEDLLYELSLSGKYIAPPGPASAAVGGARPSKKARTDGGAPAEGTDFPRVTAAEFDVMRAANETFDSKREELIKRTRDVQKLSKQAIYSMHRGDLPKAEGQLAEATDKGRAIAADYLVEFPALRSGSYSNAMEEYAEARLYQIWLESREIAGPSHARFNGLVHTMEYLGGVADFTGEAGRFAVQAASRRDVEGVHSALAADQACLRAWMQLSLPGKLAKKEGALKQNTTKVQGLLYDLSVVRAASVKSAPEPAAGQDE